MGRMVARYVVLAFGVVLVAFAVVWTVANVLGGEWGNALLGTIGVVFTVMLFGYVRRLTDVP
jgi:hypothetical protein